MHRLPADLFDGQGDRDTVARPLIARVLIPDCAISQDRTRPVLQGSKLRVGADLTGRFDRAALGQGRAVATGAAGCAKSANATLRRPDPGHNGLRPKQPVRHRRVP